MVLNALVTKDTRSTFLTNFERITSPVTDFIRGNPIVSTAAIGIGVTGLIAGARVVSRVRKKKARKKVVKKRVTRRKRSKKTGKVTHAKPRHAGHKVVKFRTKDGKIVKFKVKRKNHTHKRRRRRR